jgi:hypothetical protein
VIGAVAETNKTAKKLRSAGAGILIPPGNPAMLGKASIEWIRCEPEVAVEDSKNDRRHVREELGAAPILEQYEALLSGPVYRGASEQAGLS